MNYIHTFDHLDMNMDMDLSNATSFDGNRNNKD